MEKYSRQNLPSKMAKHTEQAVRRMMLLFESGHEPIDLTCPLCCECMHGQHCACAHFKTLDELYTHLTSAHDSSSAVVARVKQVYLRAVFSNGANAFPRPCLFCSAQQDNVAFYYAHLKQHEAADTEHRVVRNVLAQVRETLEDLFRRQHYYAARKQDFYFCETCYRTRDRLVPFVERAGLRHHNLSTHKIPDVVVS
jgi:hypothetical protein